MALIKIVKIHALANHDYFLAMLLGVLLLSACCDRSQIATNDKLLYSSEAKERNDGALALARCGELAADSVPRLSELIYDKNIGVQSAAAYALRKIGTEQARFVLEEATARKEVKKR